MNATDTNIRIPCCNPKCGRTFTPAQVSETVCGDDYLCAIIAGRLPTCCETVLADEDGDGACIGEEREITRRADTAALDSEHRLRLMEGWQS